MSSLSLLTVHAWPTVLCQGGSPEFVGGFFCVFLRCCCMFVCLFIFFVLSLLAGNTSFMAKHLPIFYILGA